MNGGNARCACALGDDPLLFDQASHRPFEGFLINKKDVIDKFGDDRPCDTARLFYRDALGESFAATGDILALDGKLHCRIQLGLDTVDFHIGAHVARDGGDAADQPAATDGNNQRVEIVAIGQDFKAGSALACHHQFIVIGVDQRKATFLDQTRDQTFALIQVAPFQHHLCAVGSGPRHLGERCLRRHHDNRRDAHVHGMIGNSLRVVAC